jgi:hypothetical protein
MAEQPHLVTTDRPQLGEVARVRPLPWYAMIGVRVARLYLMTLLGLLGAGQTGVIDPVNALAFAVQLKGAALAAIGPAVVCLLWNATEILAQLDVRKPELRA